LDGKSHLFPLLNALFLERGCGADGGVEGYIISPAVGRAGLDITAAFALGMRTRTAAGMLTG
jgi:hypothetical protein